MATVLEMIHNAASELRNQRHKGVSLRVLETAVWRFQGSDRRVDHTYCPISVDASSNRTRFAAQKCRSAAGFTWGGL